MIVVLFSLFTLPFSRADGLYFHGTNIQDTSEPSDFQWFSITNPGPSSVSTSDWHLAFFVWGGDPSNDFSVDLPPGDITAGQVIYYTSDVAALQTHFGSSITTLPFTPQDFDGLAPNLLGSLSNMNTGDYDTLDPYIVDVKGLKNLNPSAPLSNTEYYSRTAYTEIDGIAGISEIYAIATYGSSGASSSVSASASPSPASASSSPIPAGCEPGVWDTPDGLTKNGFVPFSPRLLVADFAQDPADASGLVYDGTLGGGAIRFRVLFSDWFSTHTTTLSTSSCSSTSFYSSTTSFKTPTETRCPYSIQQASFSLENCEFTVTPAEVGSDYDLVSGYITAEANATTTFLGTDFERSFRTPLGFYFKLAKSFSVNSQITITENNECYENVDCNYFTCGLSEDSPNTCDCNTTYNSGNISPAATVVSYCEQFETGGNKCFTDDVKPYCNVPEDITVTYTSWDQAPVAIASETRITTSSWSTPVWDDCDAEHNSTVHDLQTSTIKVTHNDDYDSGTFSSINPSEALNPTAVQYADTSRGNVVFEPSYTRESNTVTYTVEYNIVDLSGNVADDCSFTVTVIDTAAPSCQAEVLALPSTLRGTHFDDWSTNSVRWISDSLLFPANFPESDNSLAMAALANGITNYGYAQELALWTQSNCWNEVAAGVYEPVPQDYQSYAYCDRLEIKSQSSNALLVTIDINSFLEDNHPNNHSAMFAELPTYIASQIEAAETVSCDKTEFPAFEDSGGNSAITTCMAEGDYVVSLVVADGATNEFQCHTTDFTVDNTPPALMCPTEAFLWTSLLQLESSRDAGWVSAPQPAKGIDNAHSIYQIVTNTNDAYTPNFGLGVENDVDFGSDAVYEHTLVWQINAGTIDKTQYTHYSDMSEFETAISSGLSLQHPQSFENEISTSLTGLDSDLARLYALYMSQDAVGNTKICSVQYEVIDSHNPSISCSDDSHDLDASPASFGSMVTHPLVHSDLISMINVTDAQKPQSVWTANAGSVLVDITVPSFDYCDLYSTSIYLTGYDANQGREDMSRRRVADYPSLCENYFTELTTSNYELDVRTVQSTPAGASAVDLSVPDATILALHRHPSVSATFTLDYLKDSTLSLTDGSTGYLSERIANSDTTTCSRAISVVDVTAPDKSIPCDQEWNDPQFEMAQTESCTTIGIAQDHLNYEKMSATVQDNGQLYASPYYEYVHLEPSYLSNTSDKTSSTCFERGSHDITYTFYDSSGNVDSCVRTITVNDVISPEPQDARCGVPAGNPVLVNMAADSSSATYDLSFTVTEGQGEFGTEWTVALTGSTSGLYSTLNDTCTYAPDGETDCTPSSDDGVWDCTATLLLSIPGRKYSCTLTFTDTDVPPGANKQKPADQSCSFDLALDDPQPPTLDCPHNQSTDAYVIDYPLDEPYFNGDITIQYTVIDNAGINSNDTFPDSSVERTHTFDYTVSFTNADRDGGGSQSPNGTTPLEGIYTYYKQTITDYDAYGNSATCDVYYRFRDAQPPTFTCPHNESNVTVTQESGHIVAITNSGFTIYALSLNRNTGSPFDSPFFSLADNSYSTTTYDSSSGDYDEVFLEIAVSSVVVPGDEDWRTDHALPLLSFDTSVDPSAASIILETMWINDILVTLTATDANAPVSGQSVCTFTLHFEDVLAPVLDDCETAVPFTVTDSTFNLLSDEDPDLENLWTSPDGYAEPGTAADLGQNTVTLYDPATVCDPTANGVALAWCPPYSDFLGDIGISSYGGNQTFTTRSSLTFYIEDPTDFTFIADDARDTSNNSDPKVCTFTVVDDVVPAWTGCGYENTGHSSYNEDSAHFYDLSVQFVTSELLTGTLPSTSTWDWADTSVQNVVYALFDTDLPMPQDNTNAGYMTRDAEDDLVDLFADQFFDSIGTMVPYVLQADMTVEDVSGNTANCFVDYEILDNVPPEVVCTSELEPVYYLNNCTNSANNGTDLANPKTSCDHSLTYRVHEDIALKEGFCTQYANSADTCLNTPVLIGTLKSNAGKTHDVTEVLEGGSGTVTPPYIQIYDADSFDDNQPYTREQQILDWQDTTEEGVVATCDTIVTVIDDVVPYPLHGVEAHTGYGGDQTLSDTCHTSASAAAADQKKIRLMQNTTTLDLPYAILPAPWARDAAHLSVDVTRDSVSELALTSSGAEVTGDNDHTLRNGLGVGTHNFTYRYYDSSGNEAFCYWQARVYDYYEAASTTVFTVQYYTSGGGSSRRRRAVLAGGDVSQAHSLRKLLQTPPAFDTTTSSLTLQYVVSATYPYVPSDTSSINAADGYEVDTTPIDEENCNPETRTFNSPDHGTGNWGDNEGVCFKTYQVTKQGVDCNSVAEFISFDHTLECIPHPNETYHFGAGGLSALSSSVCQEDAEEKLVTITIAAQYFCAVEITTVDLDSKLYLGSESWMNSILSSGEGAYGSYYSDDLTGETNLDIIGNTDVEQIKVCGIVLVRIHSDSVNVGTGGVQFDGLNLNEIQYNGSSVTLSPQVATYYTNMVGFCLLRDIPPLASNEDNSFLATTYVTVSGTVDYEVNGVSRRRTVLYEESADFQVSEVYSFTATRGADDDPFFTPNTDAASDGSKPVATWALPVGLALLFLLCLCAGCTFMGYKSCLWAKDVVVQNGNLKSVPLPELPGPNESELARLHLGEDNPPALSLSTLGARAEVYTDQNEAPW